jgi:hypothetical protein
MHHVFWITSAELDALLYTMFGLGLGVGGLGSLILRRLYVNHVRSRRMHHGRN